VAASNLIYVGQRVLIETIFRYSGVPTDPTIVTCTYRSPSGTVSTLTYPDDAFTRRSEGTFEASILVDTAGQWAFRSEGAGVVDAVSEYLMNVYESNI
jgi:hypothetical protein